ncbi:DUF2958 domain-containing protein [Bradyrhizobium sp. 1]|nr:DUF2958 domain-containing protein [Bradyrhizobium sp. 1]
MKMLLDQQRERLRTNGQFNASRRARGETEIDFMPVVKLCTPWAGATWLLTELDSEDPDIAFGLCGLGLGFPELGNLPDVVDRQYCQTVFAFEFGAPIRRGPHGARIPGDRCNQARPNCQPREPYHPTPAQRRPNTGGLVFTACQPKK